MSKQLRHSMVPAIYLIMKNDQGKILGILRSHTGYMDGYYTLPSGHVERGELPIKGMVREAKEEVGIDINPKDLTFAHLMIRPEENETGERMDVFFEVQFWQGEPQNTEPEKHEKIEWLDPNDYLVPWMPYQKKAIENIFRDIKYSEWNKDE